MRVVEADGEMRSRTEMECLLAGATAAYEKASGDQQRQTAMLIVTLCCWVLGQKPDTPESEDSYKALDLLRESGQNMYREAYRILSDEN